MTDMKREEICDVLCMIDPDWEPDDEMRKKFTGLALKQYQPRPVHTGDWAGNRERDRKWVLGVLKLARSLRDDERHTQT